MSIYCLGLDSNNFAYKTCCNAWTADVLCFVWMEVLLISGGLYNCIPNTFCTHTFLSYTIYWTTIPNTFCIDTFLSHTFYSAVVCCSWLSTIAFLPLYVTCSTFCNFPPIYIPLTLVPVNNFRWHMILLLLYLTKMNGGWGIIKMAEKINRT